MNADLAMVKLLLHRGCDINAVGGVLGWTVLQVAVAQGSSQQAVDEQEAMIILLLEEGAKTTILHSAALLPGSGNVIQLLQMGIQADTLDSFRRPALHYAVQ